jgi:hypothetical protein
MEFAYNTATKCHPGIASRYSQSTNMDQAKVSIQFLTMAGSIDQASIGALGRKLGLGRMHCFCGLVDFLHIGSLFVRVTVMSSCVAALRGICPRTWFTRDCSPYSLRVSELGIRRIRWRQRLLSIGRFSILWIRRYGDEGYSKRQDARDRIERLYSSGGKNGQPTPLCGEVV